jgi:signal peptidase II
MAVVHKFFSIAGAVFLLDRIAKTIFLKNSFDFGFLNLHLVKNTGGFWGVFQGANFLFIFISLFVLLGIFFFLRRILSSSISVWLAFSLVIGGGISNLVDRVALGYVVDFIDFGFWPAFNIADAAITVAIFLLVFNELKVFFKKKMKFKKNISKRV